MPAGHTPLHGLAGPLHHLSGSDRFYNLLERNGFASVEEVAATPEGCWFELHNCGTRFIAAVRQVIAGLQPGDAQPGTGSLPQASFNMARPSPGIAQRVPDGEHRPPRATVTGTGTQHIRRKPILGGLVNEYTHAA